MPEVEVITNSKRGLPYLHTHLQHFVYFYSIIAKTCEYVLTCTDTAINKYTKSGGGGGSRETATAYVSYSMANLVSQYDHPSCQ